MSIEYQLPESDDIDVSVFSRLFADVTNSYKFLFALALMESLERQNFKQARIPMSDLQAAMLHLAWYPHVYFKLSFGKLDKISRLLNEVGEELIGKDIKVKDRQILSAALKELSASDSEIFGDLLRFVPYRLIRPFFAEELRGLKDQAVNGRFAELSQEYFVQRKPLYKLSAKPTEIEIHPDWLEYLKTNAPIIRSWINWHWLKYMQRCNPSSPNIADKLFYPEERSSLSKQTNYWRPFISEGSVLCIYSGEQIYLDNFSLDHYIPWSFIVHDLIWNLIPTTRPINSSKSNRIASDKYFEKFVSLQHQFLCFNAKTLKDAEFEKLVEPYLRDLRSAEPSSLLDFGNLSEAYSTNIKPVIALASANGFASGWEFEKTAEY